jgi:abortive infection bacteriophage resistance protein
MVERIEVAIRTRMIYHFSLGYGANWFENVALVKDARALKKNCKQLEWDTSRSTEIYLREHYKKYHADPNLPPSWKTLEVVTLGKLSKMYKNLKPGLPEKDIIAKEMGLPDQQQLENWLHGVAVMRNIAAHHNRLFQRTIPLITRAEPALPGKWIDLTSVNKQSVYYQLSRMAYLLQFISPGNRFALRLKELFAKYSATVKFKEVGFPANWTTQPLWK